VGDTGGGDALVLDPRRDVEVYLQAATRSGMRIRYVIDTHQHNDYVSGARELAERTGATVLAGDQAQVTYDHRPARDGEQLDLGDLGVHVLHTPGHTPEHLSLLLYDGEVSRDEPAILLSGGALLVGDVARPDLLGDEEQTRQAASTMCATLQTRLLDLPESTIVYPTHVSGSLCGGSIASRLSTTIGYEKRTNPMLARVAASDEFVEQCLNLENLPAVPPYWARMRTENQRGPDLLGAVPPPPALQPAEFADAVGDPDLIVLDTRPAEAFAGGHIPGAVNVGLGASFATWAGTALPAGARVLLVVADPGDVLEATWQLLRIGYPVPAGWLAGGMFATGPPAGPWPGWTPSPSQTSATQARTCTCSTSASLASGPPTTRRTHSSSPARRSARASRRCPATARSSSPAAAATAPPSSPACCSAAVTTGCTTCSAG
jgi:hydroxyacylglutathione hydrolase